MAPRTPKTTKIKASKALSASTRLKSTARDNPNAVTAAIHRDIALKQRDRANMVDMLEETHNARAPNTKKNYDPKQAEFINWAI